MARAKHVAVLMGGWSAEREVSVNSGRACAEALEQQGYRVTRIDVGRDIATLLQTLKPDVALNVLHGRPGEDGTLQGILEILAIPYTHSGVLASALAMRKDVAKTVFRAAGIPVPDGMVVPRAEAAQRHVLPRPYVIKPLAEGSSVGVFIVTEEHGHPPQELTRDDWPYGDELIAERYVPGKELTCAVMGDRALDVIEILPATGFYDYEAKYAPGGSPRPAGGNFTNCLPRGPKTGSCGSPCARLPGREPCRLPLRRQHGGDRGIGLSRSQYATRHDRDLAGPRARGPCGYFVQ